MSGVHAYILANGESRRFNKETKALKVFAGKPLIQHVIERLHSQTNAIAINGSHPNLAQFGLELIDDLTPPYSGPTAGLYACMAHLHKNSNHTWLMLSACDTPFIALNLIEQLREQAEQKSPGKTKMSCFRYEGYLEPTFSLWHRDLFEEIEHAVLNKQIKGFKPLIAALGERASVVDYPKSTYSEPNPFFNVNTPADLAEAEKHIKHEQ